MSELEAAPLLTALEELLAGVLEASPIGGTLGAETAPGLGVGPGLGLGVGLPAPELAASELAALVLRLFFLPVSAVADVEVSPAAPAELSSAFLLLVDFFPTLPGSEPSPAAASELFAVFLDFFFAVSAEAEVSDAVVPDALSAFLLFFAFFVDFLLVSVFDVSLALCAFASVEENASIKARLTTSIQNVSLLLTRFIVWVPRK